MVKSSSEFNNTMDNKQTHMNYMSPAVKSLYLIYDHTLNSGSSRRTLYNCRLLNKYNMTTIKWFTCNFQDHKPYEHIAVIVAYDYIADKGNFKQ